MKPYVSIIIPTKNEAGNIEKCIQSCRSQNYQKIEIIVIDNFSKDKTYQIAKKLADKTLKKGTERSSQRNFGAKKAKGSYLLFLDADMQLTKKAFSEGLSKIKKGNSIVAFPELSKGENFWGKAIALERNLYQEEKDLAAARFFPKELFLKLKGFDEKLVAGEDWDLTIRAKRFGHKLLLTKNKIIHKEKSLHLKEIIKKKEYYSQQITLYAKKHSSQFRKQSNLLYRLGIYLKNLPKILRDPVHGIAFLTLKSLIWYNWRKNSKLIK